MKTLLVTIALGATLVSTQAGAQAPGGGRPDMTRPQAQAMADAMFQRMDLNHDGVVTRAEAEQARAQMGGGDDSKGGARAEHMIARVFGDAQSVTQAQVEAAALARFDRQDLNHDGVVTAAEREQARGQRLACGAHAAGRFLYPPLSRDEHPQQHRHRARHADLAFEPQADRRARHPDRLGEVVLGAIAEAAHRRAQLVGGHGVESVVQHEARSHPRRGRRCECGSPARHR
jgi:hypothetical protein